MLYNNLQIYYHHSLYLSVQNDNKVWNNTHLMNLISLTIHYQQRFSWFLQILFHDIHPKSLSHDSLHLIFTCMRFSCARLPTIVWYLLLWSHYRLMRRDLNPTFGQNALSKHFPHLKLFFHP